MPTVNVSFSSIPKTGCTTLKNYLFALEQDQIRQDKSETAAFEYVGHDIHRPTVMRHYQVNTLKVNGPADSLKILVLRNPYHRALSAWVNKLVFAQNDYGIFEKLRDEPFTPVEFFSVEDLNQAFEKFTERLASDKKFLQSNTHWLPQVDFFDDVLDYDVVLETSGLGELQGIIEKHLKSQGRISNRSFPHFNATSSVLVSHIGTRASWDFVGSTYKKDLKALTDAGLAVKRPDDGSTLKEPITQQALEQEKAQILESRRYYEVQCLRNDLADHDIKKRLELELLEKQIRELKASWSWRLTAWLRWILALYLKDR